MSCNDSATNASPSSNRSRYWRSLSELHESEDFKQYLHREFPVAASEFPEGVSRRRWLQLMGASLAVAGATGCRYPEEQIAPFVLRPEGRVPGEVYSRSTNFELAGRVYNLLINNIDGRPIKIEPNTDHPSGGGTDAYVQACVLGLYDPDRSRGDDGVILRREKDARPKQVGWDTFETLSGNLVRSAAASGGKGVAVLTTPSTSPTNARQLGEFKKRYPESVIARYDGVNDGVMRAATNKVFGKSLSQSLQLGEAKVIVSIQSDILGNAPGFVSNARGFAEKRDPVNGEMSRLYVVEANYTLTGAAADSRLAIRPSQMPAFISELGRRVEAMKSGEAHSHVEGGPFNELGAEDRLERFLDALAHDVHEAGEGAVIVVGEHLGADAVAAGIQMNQQLGSLGKLQKFSPEVDGQLDVVSLADLTNKMTAGEVDTLLILDGNPVFTCPGDIDFAGALASVENSIYLGAYDDETAELCGWSLPLAHPLESWGDCVNEAGDYGVCQPQILPLLGGRTVSEVLALVTGSEETEGSAIVRRTADSIGSALSDRQWRKLLHDGFSKELVIQSGTPSPSGSAKELTADAPSATTEISQDDIEIVFSAADGLYDGRFANNGWLQEMPQSLTKLTWDNAAIVSPATAKALKVEHGDQIALRNQSEGLVTLPVYVMPGIAPGVVAAAIGYGRTRAGVVGGLASEEVDAVGVDVSPIRTSDSMLVAYAMEARPRYTKYDLNTTQDHWAIDELGQDETERRSFNLVREGTVELLKNIPEFVDATPKAPHVPQVGEYGSPFEEPINVIEKKNEEDGGQLPQWGMSIDLSKCIGCNACVVACQSENNVPIVGKEQVGNSREMHWLRVDRYFQGDEENADVVQEPVACMHCETAPCEQVCPVAATVHTEEGINAMTYNRCIGTRYCANNCPFKVRRFNYFNYNEDVGQGYGINAYQGNIESANRKLQQLVLNPDVSVRGRGVMEKCTYCIQRVEQGKITAMKDGRRPIQDGDVITACQAACPTRAIDFGNIADPESAVSKKRADVRSYGMLEQLNVKPRTEYLARVRNPHPSLRSSFQIQDLETMSAPHHGHDDHGSEGHDAHGHEGEHGDETEAAHS